MEYADNFLTFINDAPTPFHAVKEARERLEAAGFVNIKERDAWSSILKPGGKYYLTRNTTTLAAFAIGKKWTPGNPISMIGAHTDSCCLRIKPNSKKQSDGFLQVGVETYGGGLWHTWFDRDLGLAGRVMCKADDGSLVQKLVKIDRPILRIPTLAIHFGRSETFEFNKETQLFPIASMVAAELDRQGGAGGAATSEDQSSTFAPLKAVDERHHPHIVELLAKEAGVSPSSIQDFEVILFDVQKSCLGGLNNDWLFSGRLDDLMMSYCAVAGIIESLSSPTTLDSDSTIRCISLFDHEEIGSLTAQGADSNLLPSLIRRLSILPSSRETDSDDSYVKVAEDGGASAYEQSLATSFLISADMAHSVNPNYSAKYEADHRPAMNAGPVVKVNANARYATNSPGVVLLQEIAKRAKSPLPSSASTYPSGGVGVPLQLFVVRNDSPCGGTIGPMLSAKLGVRTLDLGNAQLSMHSIRETAGALDVGFAVRLFASFFENYGELEPKILVD